jgi:hypothetical protein
MVDRSWFLIIFWHVFLCRFETAKSYRIPSLTDRRSSLSIQKVPSQSLKFERILSSQ